MSDILISTDPFEDNPPKTEEGEYVGGTGQILYK